MLMTFLTIGNHLQHVHVAQADGLRRDAEKMNADMTELSGEARFVTVHAAHVAVCRAMHCAHIGRHFVAACAALAGLRSIVAIGSEDATSDDDGHAGDNQGKNAQKSVHDLMPVPFQLPTSDCDAK